MKSKKVHRFESCPNIWRHEEQPKVTKDISKITCGQCKQRILNVLLKRDWATTLTREVSMMLWIIANDVLDAEDTV